MLIISNSNPGKRRC